jgi:hypothetical protein
LVELSLVERRPITTILIIKTAVPAKNVKPFKADYSIEF